MIRFILGLSILIVSGLAETKLERLMQKCDNNESGACAVLTIRYAHGYEKDGIKPDTLKMLEYAMKACNIDLYYCNYVAQIYKGGINGVQKKYAQSRRIL
jgi:hypothetical protein